MMLAANRPLIHFAHANGMPSLVYQKLFDELADVCDVIYIEPIGVNKHYPITEGWPALVDQLIDNIVQKAQGRQVVGVGHSLGAVLTLMASKKRPELFSQIILLDPPLILGKHALLFQLAKRFLPNQADKMTPAGLSKHRREHWQSIEQAAQLLLKKKFYQSFDPVCFKAYLEHGLRTDLLRGGITLTIPRQDEVAIFRTNPSWSISRHYSPDIPAQIIVGQQSPFYTLGFVQQASKQFGIAYSQMEGGHMFPLERPIVVAEKIKTLIIK